MPRTSLSNRSLTDGILWMLNRLLRMAQSSCWSLVLCRSVLLRKEIISHRHTIQVDGQERPMSFTQTFHLKPADGTYYVFNDIFRLVYPAA
jgi:hypothetical protein